MEEWRYRLQPLRSLQTARNGHELMGKLLGKNIMGPMAGQPTYPSKIKAWTLPAWLRETTPLGLYFSGRGTLGRVAWSAIKWSGCFVGGAELLGVGVPVGWGKVHALHTINVHVKSIHLHFLGCKSLSFTRSLLVFVALGYFEGPFACCFPEEFMNVYVYIYTHSFPNGSSSPTWNF